MQARLLGPRVGPLLAVMEIELPHGFAGDGGLPRLGEAAHCPPEKLGTRSFFLLIKIALSGPIPVILLGELVHEFL